MPNAQHSINFGKWFLWKMLKLLTCFTMLIILFEGVTRTHLPQPGSFVKNILTPLSHFLQSKKTDARTRFSLGVSEGNSSLWLSHLCPRYQAEYEAAKGYMKLEWQTPTEDTIFFTQTSCRTSLMPREVRQ